MKILHEKPPEWIMQGCLNQFRVNVDRTYWTYGDTLYNPGGRPLPDDIFVHEERHSRQQEVYQELDVETKPGEHADVSSPRTVTASGKDAWWRRYLADPRFRMEMESDAYAAQYRFFCSRERDRNRRALYLHGLARTLAGSLYQVAIPLQKAREMIRVLSGVA